MPRVVVTTNNKPRDFLYWYELNNAERKEFDYLDNGEDNESAQFFRYKGNTYCLAEFMAQSGFGAWHASAADSFFSGICIKIVNDGDSVIVGRFYSSDEFED